jgi:hypothetical protein
MNASFSNDRSQLTGMRISHLATLAAIAAVALGLGNTACAGVIPEPEQVMGETISHSMEFDLMVLSSDISDFPNQVLTGTFDSNMDTGTFSYSYPVQIVNGIPVSWSASGSGDLAAGHFSVTTAMQSGDEQITGQTTYSDFFGDPDRTFEFSFVSEVPGPNGKTFKWRWYGTGTITSNADGTDTSTEHINYYLWIESQQRWRFEVVRDYTDTSTYDKRTSVATLDNTSGVHIVVNGNDKGSSGSIPEPSSLVSLASGTLLLLACALRSRGRRAAIHR